jgi:L-fuculose-phosphate aldolase
VRLRRAVVAAARALNADGLSQGTSGNVSARAGGGFLVTPSGVGYGDLTADSIVQMDMNGGHTGRLLPSSEWRVHRDIYAAREDAGAVVHAHAPFATTLACLGRGIPAFHYMVAVAGGHDIRCAGYATFGTQALSDKALRALDGRRACLLANHGLIAIGGDPEGALALANEVETLAGMYWRALQVGEPRILSRAEMRRVLRKFETYGKQPED